MVLLTHSITRYQFRGLGLVWFLSLREGGAKSKAVKRKMPGLYAVGGGSYRSILRCAFLWSPLARFAHFSGKRSRHRPQSRVLLANSRVPMPSSHVISYRSIRPRF